MLLDDFILSENLIVTVLQLIYDTKFIGLTESDYEHFHIINYFLITIMYLPCFCLYPVLGTLPFVEVVNAMME